jgi:hypothetical protein
VALAAEGQWLYLRGWTWRKKQRGCWGSRSQWWMLRGEEDSMD